MKWWLGIFSVMSTLVKIEQIVSTANIQQSTNPGAFLLPTHLYFLILRLILFFLEKLIIHLTDWGAPPFLMKIYPLCSSLKSESVLGLTGFLAQYSKSPENWSGDLKLCITAEAFWIMQELWNQSQRQEELLLSAFFQADVSSGKVADWNGQIQPLEKFFDLAGKAVEFLRHRFGGHIGPYKI